MLDASITLTWFLEDEPSPSSAADVLRRLETDTAIVPALWALELANALVVAERKQQLTEAATARVLSLVRALPIEVDETPSRDTLATIVGLARGHRLSAYDAAYLELAIRLGVPLATVDRRLGEAAQRAGVSLAGTRE